MHFYLVSDMIDLSDDWEIGPHYLDWVCGQGVSTEGLKCTAKLFDRGIRWVQVCDDDQLGSFAIEQHARGVCAAFQVCSLLFIKSSTDGTSEGSPDQGNRGGWYPSMQKKRLISVEVLINEFWICYHMNKVNNDSSRIDCYGCKTVEISTPLSWAVHPVY